MGILFIDVVENTGAIVNVFGGMHTQEGLLLLILSGKMVIH